MLTPQFWLANRFTPTMVDIVFRLTSAAILSSAGRHRFVYGGIGQRQLNATLRRARGVHGWTISWVHTARTYLAAARNAAERQDFQAEAVHRATAARSLHYARLLTITDLERRHRLYNAGARLFRSVAPSLPVAAKAVEIPWRDVTLPGYLRLPDELSRQNPLVVFINGASTVKEETTNWSMPFLRRGFAILALDTPGSGEAFGRAQADPDQVDIGEAIIRFAQTHPALDPARVALLGISIGGAMAVRNAAATDELAGVIAVTPPFHPSPYFRHLNVLVQQEISILCGATDDALDAVVERMSLVDVAPRLRVPQLVIGAGRDLVVPPGESIELHRAAGGPSDLMFLKNANHVAFSHMHEWTTATLDWLTRSVAA